MYGVKRNNSLKKHLVYIIIEITNNRKLYTYFLLNNKVINEQIIYIESFQQNLLSSVVAIIGFIIYNLSINTNILRMNFVNIL